MLTAYTVRDEVLQRQPVTQISQLTDDVRWLDLNNPTEQERQWVQQAYGQQLLFIEELGEIEASARFYRDEQGLHLHLYFLHRENGASRNIDVAFTVSQGRLYTLHSEDAPELRSYYTHVQAHPELRDEAMCILLGIVSVRLGVLADAYERLQAEMEALSRNIFHGDDPSMNRVLETLARIEDTHSKAHMGLIAEQRVFSSLRRTPEGEQYAESIDDILRDVDSLTQHSRFLFERTKFMMDTTLGMINVGFSRRLNVFTVLSVVLMPPMLIASIYGMNFRHMPELDWLWGYPFALTLAAVSAIGPILWLKRKGWV
ncbi:MAG TPA: CorA family divalent cation transporter [Burkholderiales bacterium]|nr:CorA family divalent cation transporter [Burkholderiales bacterium]